ncbi:MAG: phosphate acetyltransferase [bacterium]
MNIIEEIKSRAKGTVKKIILPESMDERVLSAGIIAHKEGIADITLIGNKDELILKNSELSILTIIDPATSDLTDKFIEEFVEMRKHKGMDENTAKELFMTDYMYFACMLVKNNLADGIVSGACHSTSNTLRPALQIIKTSKNSKLVSSFFLMDVPNCELGSNGAFIFSDAGLEQNPTAENLAAIAYDSAKNCELFLGVKSKTAFLSHSTHGSAKHADVEKVVNAVAIAKESYPDYLMDGELQLDAAIIPEVALSKAPNSPLKGESNVLVFPDLDAANIGYKLVQRLAKAHAYGPICQGMNKAVNDLSRGCSVEDIVGTIAITSVQSNNI